MRKLILILPAILALVGGAVAGDMLRSPGGKAATGHEPEAAGKHDAGHEPVPTDDAHDDGHGAPADAHGTPAKADHGGGHGGGGAVAGEPAYFTFPTQFFVPLTRQGDMRGMMILTLTLQTDGADLAALARKEHILRDALLRQLMIHANTGGFDGNFTAERSLAPLRAALLKTAQEASDQKATAVLIEDIARQ
ncbi:hypothetical protein [Paracoccus sp. (in: a-proteobacteria)]|uniref:hypothetical protein n=1 Tax=Paracoccus sp. TaxID=267 RepID=UPI00396CBBF0